MASVHQIKAAADVYTKVYENRGFLSQSIDMETIGKMIDAANAIVDPRERQIRDATKVILELGITLCHDCISNGLYTPTCICRRLAIAVLDAAGVETKP